MKIPNYITITPNGFRTDISKLIKTDRFKSLIKDLMKNDVEGK